MWGLLAGAAQGVAKTADLWMSDEMEKKKEARLQAIRDAEWNRSRTAQIEDRNYAQNMRQQELAASAAMDLNREERIRAAQIEDRDLQMDLQREQFDLRMKELTQPQIEVVKDLYGNPTAMFRIFPDGRAERIDIGLLDNSTADSGRLSDTPRPRENSGMTRSQAESLAERDSFQYLLNFETPDPDEYLKVVTDYQRQFNKLPIWYKPGSQWLTPAK